VTPAPRLAAFDGLERVIQIGSFSKTLSASVRCGFIAARPTWIDGLIDLKIATSFGGAGRSAVIVHTLLMDGSYRKHVETLRQRLSRARSETAARLKTIGIAPWIEPQAGMFLWCKLSDGLDAADIARRALAKNIVLALATLSACRKRRGASCGSTWRSPQIKRFSRRFRRR
jgi:DNA-binding transcriptional MocR family regulator